MDNSIICVYCNENIKDTDVSAKTVDGAAHEECVIMHDHVNNGKPICWNC